MITNHLEDSSKPSDSEDYNMLEEECGTSQGLQPVPQDSDPSPSSGSPVIINLFIYFVLNWM